MGTQVTLPLWAAFILTLLAVWAAVDRILVPSVRWAVQRRANRSIEELNTRLKLRMITSTQLTKSRRASPAQLVLSSTASWITVQTCSTVTFPGR